ncbi:MAG TPA: hypothetical protein VIC62_04010 [Nakamurella sp.]
MSGTTTQTKDRPQSAGAAAGASGPLGSETSRWSSATTASSRRAYERRIRRRQKMSDDRLVRPGRTVSRTAFNRAPFVIALIVLLGLGVTAVLWLNTLTDEAGMRTSTAKSKTTDLRLTIEQLRRDVAMLDATPRIADQAKALGMVQAGDSAMLIVDGSGTGTVVGEPSAVAAPAPPPAPTSGAAPAAAPSPVPAAQPGPAAASTPPVAQPAQPDPAAQPGPAAQVPADQAAAAPTTPASVAPAGEPQGAGQ